MVFCLSIKLWKITKLIEFSVYKAMVLGFFILYSKSEDGFKQFPEFSFSFHPNSLNSKGVAEKKRKQKKAKSMYFNNYAI